MRKNLIRNPNDDSDYPGSSVATYQSYTSQISSFGKWAEESGGGFVPIPQGDQNIRSLDLVIVPSALAGMIYSHYEGDGIIEADVDNDQMPDAWERAAGAEPIG